MSNQDGEYDIFTLTFDALNQPINMQNLTANLDGDAYYPTWSPDGTQIAFHLQPHSGDLPTIHTMNADGSNKQSIAIGESPTWSENGEYIYFSEVERNGELVLGSQIVEVNLNTSEAQVIMSPEICACIESTVADSVIFGNYVVAGDRAVFQINESIYQLDLDTQQIEFLTAGIDPAFSPDGSNIAIGTGAILILNRDYDNAIVVPKGTPTWSPDGTYIAYDGLYRYGNFAISVKIAQEGLFSGRTIFNGFDADYRHPSWRPIVNP